MIYFSYKVNLEIPILNKFIPDSRILIGISTYLDLLNKENDPNEKDLSLLVWTKVFRQTPELFTTYLYKKGLIQ